MSLCAPKSYWDYHSLLNYMNEDTIVSILKMSEIQLNNRISLVNTVLDNHHKAMGVLDGKINDEMVECVSQYRDMLSVVVKNPQQFEIYKNDDRLEMGGGLRSYIS